MKHISILNDLEKTQIYSTPFPHIIIQDALPKVLADQLTLEFPIELFDMSDNNKRKDISSKAVQANEEISSIWREFIHYHSSAHFFNEILSVFKPFFSDYEFNYYSEFSSGIRGQDRHKDKQILLDAQISINTPVHKTSSVRKVHVDNTNKLFSGLYYLRRPNDDSSGGDLEILKWNASYSEKEKLKFYKEGACSKHFTTLKQIKYDNNVAVIFLNSLNALHLVTPRQPTIHPRCFVNLVGELNEDIFKKYGYFQEKMMLVRDKVRKIF